MTEEEEKIQEPVVEESVEEEEKLEVEKETLEVPESEDFVEEKPISAELEGWKPKTSVGKQVQSGEITDIDVIIDSGKRILEPQIADALLPGLQKELLLVGQSKGKFGGGARRIFKQTQKKTPEGNNPSFACFAVVGNEDGYVGGGFGKSKDTVPAREKATRNAKLNVFKIRRGCGSWECGCKTPHSIPFEVSGKCGSVSIKLMPAPKGKGLCIEPECAKILKLAGIKDVWSKTFGQTRVKTNLVKACVVALKELMKVKVNPDKYAALGIAEGRATTRAQEEEKNE
ncbi:30S ribosomal protein S5 [Candidatus Woesearchaeota archaeon]|nr:30S ribosomal protein S5 [Candidatus Woesearchaeota archaeon]